MKNSLLILALGAAVAVPAQGAVNNIEPRAIPEGVQAVNKMRAHVQQINEKKVWKPGTVVNYDWDIYSGDWELNSTTYYTYDEETGRIKSELQRGTRLDYEYNADGQIASVYAYSIENDDDEGVLSSKTIYTYDEIIPDYCIKTEQYAVIGDVDILFIGMGRNITRNDDGNITKIHESFYFYFDEDPQWSYASYYVAFEYGADGKASGIYEFVYDFDTKQWNIERYLKNITWYTTDGQITETDWKDPNFYMGANRIKSADVKLDNIESLGKLNAVYPTERSVRSETTLDEEVVEYVYFTYLDEYNSFDYAKLAIAYGYDPDTETWSRDGNSSFTLKRVYDSFGYEVNTEERDYTNGVCDFYLDRVATATFDAEYGYPTQYIVTMCNTEGGTFINESRKDLFNYVQVTDGIESVTVSDENAPVEYYNLQGVRVSNPQGGIFIRRQGSSVSKVAL